MMQQSRSREDYVSEGDTSVVVTEAAPASETLN